MSKEIKRFFIDESSELHGRGGNKKVYHHKDRPDVVVKEGSLVKNHPEHALLRHYITNIIHLVTDGGTPRSNFSFSKEDLQGVEKVDLGPAGDAIRNIQKRTPYETSRKAEKKISNDPRVIALRENLRRIKTPYFDDQPKNFGVSNDGRAVYVDDVVLLNYNIGPFIEAITPEIEKMTDEGKKKKAKKYLERVNKLLKKYPS